MRAVSDFTQYLSSIEEIIEEARNGRMFILVDDEDRENEGDLVIPAQMATPSAINFMAKYGRGLICLSLPRERCQQLGLPLMNPENASRHQTAFTMSIEAKEGVTTGISASDRAHTIAVAVDPSKGAADIVTPGHIFPLMARDGGVLVRAGHTEAAVDLSRLAGLSPAGVICEIMNDDGTMARMPDLVKFAQFHGLKIATIADLIAYRRRHERIVRREVSTTLNSYYGGEWQVIVYVNTLSGAEHLAVIKGDIKPDEPVLVRVHAVNIIDDALGDLQGGKVGQLHSSMRLIAEAGNGVIVLIREPLPDSLSNRIRAHRENRPVTFDLRDYGIGAQMLLDLGVKRMILLSNTPRHIVGLEGYGLEVVETRKIPVLEEH